MEFPALVYRAEGRHSRPNGTYDFIVVENQEEFDAKIKDGWFESLQAAISGKSEFATVTPTSKKSPK